MPTLSLVAQIVNKFSAPLRDMSRDLTVFDEKGRKVSTEGAKLAKFHAQQYQELTRQTKEVARTVKELLVPTMNTLGIGSISAGAALAAVTKSVIAFGESAKSLAILRQETGLTISQLRQFHGIAEIIGTTNQALDQGFKSAKAVQDLWQNWHTGPIQDWAAKLRNMPGMDSKSAQKLRDFAESMRVFKGTFQEYTDAVLTMADSIMNDPQRRAFLSTFGFDPDLANTTSAERKKLLADAKSDMHDYSESQIKAGKDVHESWVRLKNTMEDFAGHFGAMMAPKFKAAADAIREYVKAYNPEEFDKGATKLINGTSRLAHELERVASVKIPEWIKEWLSSGELANGSPWNHELKKPEGTAHDAEHEGEWEKLLHKQSYSGSGFGDDAKIIKAAYQQEDNDPTAIQPGPQSRFPGQGTVFTKPPGTEHSLGYGVNLDELWKSIIGSKSGTPGTPGAPATPGGIAPAGGGDPESLIFRAILKGSTLGTRQGFIDAMRELRGARSGGGEGGGDGGVIKAAYHPDEAGTGGAGGAPSGGGAGGSLGGGALSAGTPGGKGGAGAKNAYDLIKQAGGTDEEARTLAGIAGAESTFRAGAHNTKGRDNSYGLWQINMRGSMGPKRRALYGLKSNDDLYDPATNARAALAMHRAAGGYGDWSTYTSGKYRQFMPSNADLGGGAAGTESPAAASGLRADYAKSQLGGGLSTFSAGGHRVTTNREAAPYFKGFIDDLKAAGAPVGGLGGFNVRSKVGARGTSQHSYGNAVDIDQKSRNVVSKKFQAWINQNQDVLAELEKKHHMVGGEHFGGGGRGTNPDTGHWEYGGPGNAVAKRARGGPVSRGKPYFVGENGPELFVPDKSGRVAQYTTPMQTPAQRQQMLKDIDNQEYRRLQMQPGGINPLKPRDSRPGRISEYAQNLSSDLNDIKPDETAERIMQEWQKKYGGKPGPAWSRGITKSPWTQQKLEDMESQEFRRHFDPGPRPKVDSINFRDRLKSIHLQQAGQKVTGSASLKIALENFPRGTRTTAKMDGMFKNLDVAQGRSMPSSAG
jgi:hypothetical protein